MRMRRPHTVNAMSPNSCLLGSECWWEACVVQHQMLELICCPCCFLPTGPLPRSLLASQSLTYVVSLIDRADGDTTQHLTSWHPLLPAVDNQDCGDTCPRGVCACWAPCRAIQLHHVCAYLPHPSPLLCTHLQDLSNNELSGALPSLPPTIRLLNLSANALDGDFPGERDHATLSACNCAGADRQQLHADAIHSSVDCNSAERGCRCCFQTALHCLKR